MVCGQVPPARVATLADVRTAETGELLDRGLVLFFPGPRSFTGEDVAEFQLHGSRAVVGEVLAALSRLPGLRLAEPGEFTRRAFELGRLDLTQAEGLADLVAAETAAQRRQALAQAAGSIRSRYDEWSDRLTSIRAQLEAEIEFSEDDDTAGYWSAAGRAESAVLSEDIARATAAAAGAARIREGFVAVIVGPPNAGKSSLLNALAGRDVAIVAAEPGTTRDLVEVALDLGGLPVTVVDTAGLREKPEGAIEQEGIRRALRRAAEADLVIVLGDGEMSDWADVDREQAVRIGSKADLLGPAERRRAEAGVDLLVSAVTGEGLDALTRLIAARVARNADVVEAPVVTRERHRVALVDCVSYLAAAGEECQPELAAEQLRFAGRSLERLAGRVDVEDVLGSIFSQFCIGK